MSSIAIMADSIACVPEEAAQQYGLTTMPFHTIVDGKDYPDNKIDMPWLYQLLKDRKNAKEPLPTTSFPPPAEFCQAYKELAQKAEVILYFSMSSPFTKGYQAAIEGKKLAQEELPHIRIDTIDSRTIEAGELLLVTGTARAISEGKDIDEVLELTHRLISRVTLLQGSETLFYRDKGGRIFQAKSWAEAQHTNTFHTLVEVDASTDGKTEPVTRARTRKQIMKTMVDIAKQKSEGNPIHAAIVHANVPQDAEQLKTLLLSQCQCDELYISEIPGVVAVHNGEGLLDLGFYITDQPD